MQITVIGAGYVGLTTAALLSHAGYKVNLIEINKDRLKSIKNGRSFFYEQGLDPIIELAIKNKTLLPTDLYDKSITDSEIVFSCVGTPDNPDGSSNLSYVFDAAKESAKYLKPGSFYVQKSTVPVGTGEKIIDMFSKLKNKVSYVSNPEFLREGTALFDTLYFDRVVAGGDDKKAVEKVLDVYRELEKNSSKIAKLAKVTIKEHQGQYISTNLNSAELIKVTSNAFLALKISFANSIAKLADKVNADINEVMDAVGADKRIGRAFLNAGRGYGGGCFPKDVSGLIDSGMQHGVNLDIMTSAQEVNQSMPGYIIEKLQNNIGGSLSNKKVAVLGLAFKAGTSDVRRSPGVHLANTLHKAGALVIAHDPQANKEAEEDLLRGISLCNSTKKAVSNADAIILATDWPEFLKIDQKEYLELCSKDCIFVDAVNAMNRETIEGIGLRYIGVGR